MKLETQTTNMTRHEVMDALSREAPYLYPGQWIGVLGQTHGATWRVTSLDGDHREVLVDDPACRVCALGAVVRAVNHGARALSVKQVCDALTENSYNDDSYVGVGGHERLSRARILATARRHLKRHPEQWALVLSFTFESATQIEGELFTDRRVDRHVLAQRTATALDVALELVRAEPWPEVIAVPTLPAADGASA